MRVATGVVFLLEAMAATASIFDALLPTETPTITSDDELCTSATLERFFDPPRPTMMSLQQALWSHQLDLYKDCTPIGTDILGIPICAFPAQSRLCAFTAAAPPSLLPKFSSYVSTASSWWVAHKSEAVELAQTCPFSWYKAMMVMAGWGDLELVIGYAECSVAEHPVVTPATITTEPTTMTEPTAMPSGTSHDQHLPMVTTTVNGAIGQAEHNKLWVVASTGLLVAAVSSA
ncbi:hypothetical protein G6O67_004612 [Ophiocordyceps sinensis]|uniref:DUF7735 domain-containing protein n=2 Tax=Ophiocordyceps sinensis TaxID=72228 RepID=A0A8H4V4M5_9HYPO|nr:hypothetical protein OCS_00397 [Ophiocordyceps sinensis CO18]KAF4508202.1 hypothetical protein G6O67_004612 [Ophiocordyceps sinensis]